ncbi:MAG TPA: pyridoxamine 5'-phosphate oxidase family protein [Candidatus Dormibacteraeota bacterium]|jgi:hypothetical protein|nr:pyridoxamine 5'-phosphate oxidase family protein [Candidatus Dormibacteraeota bacterium]
MTSAAPRSRQQRKADTLARLQQKLIDVWVSSASGAEDAVQPYLVPLSLAWIDDRIVIALDGDSRTARNITAGGRVRLGLGPTRDVVLIDADLERVTPAAEADDGLVERYVSQAGWDPRKAGGASALMLLRPRRIQAWREVNELAGRTLMREGIWLD